MYDSRIKSNIAKFYLTALFASMQFSTPIAILFMQDIGLSLTQIMLLASIYGIIVIALEIPTGYFADMYGRKNAMVIAGVSGIICLTIYGFAQNFWHMLISYIFMAVFMAMMSGAFEALIYDTLKELKKEKDMKRIMGWFNFLRLGGTAVASIIGAILGKINLRIPILLSVPFWIATTVVLTTIQEPKRHKKIITNHYDHILSIFRFVIKKKKLLVLMAYSAFIFCFGYASLDFAQPYMQDLGIDIALFGFIFAGFSIFAAFSSMLSEKIEKKLGEKKSLILPFFLIISAYILLGNIISKFSFIFFMIFYFVQSFIPVIMSDYSNRLITSDKRATVLSIQNMGGHLVFSLIIPFTGLLADAKGIFFMFNMLGIITLVMGIILLPFLRKQELI